MRNNKKLTLKNLGLPTAMNLYEAMGWKYLKQSRLNIAVAEMKLRKRIDSFGIFNLIVFLLH